jgi:hypothetical protein
MSAASIPAETVHALLPPHVFEWRQHFGEIATPHPHLQRCQATDTDPLISPPTLTDGSFCCADMAPIAVWAAHATATAYH